MLIVQYVEVYAVSLIYYFLKVSCLMSSYSFLLPEAPHIVHITVQRFIVMLPSCTLKPDDHSICISAMFAHKQIHLTRVKGLYVAAISSVDQSMKSSNRQYLMKSNSKLSLRTRIFVSKSSILRPAATIFPQYATCRFPHGIT